MDPERRENDNLIAAAPALARMAATAWLRGLRWGVETALKEVGLVQEPPGRAAGGTGSREAGSERGSGARPGREAGPGRRDEASAAAGHRDGASAEALRARGEELLRLSADVRYEEDSHPAFARILDDLAPDEARILRLLAARGAQPAVDVRSGGPLGVGFVATELVAPGLTMIGAEAGIRHVERLPAYLNNLFRLGLVWFSRESVPDPLSYQVLEAQPDVAEALGGAGRGARTIRRSILLTPFGADFCDLCLPAVGQ